MSYKCAVFGHRYGETEVEREREEDGSEVVITVRELETCTRCGKTRVVSENKEVTTLQTAADIVADDLEDTSEDSDSTAPTEAADEPETPAPDESPAQTPAEGSGVHIPEAEPDTEAPDPAEEDAVILDADDEDDEDDREPGEWPDEPAGDADAEDAVAWPQEREEAPEDDEPSWELPSDIDPHPETESADSRSSTVRPTGSALTVPEGEFYCPACEFTTPVESSSLRAGDFCPECHGATLEHRDG